MKHTCLSYIGKGRLAEISQYGSGDVTSETFADPRTWRDLGDILLFHPSAVTRHEASFVIADLQVPLAERLISAVKFDTSIVAKHEAAESLGKIEDGDDAWMAYVFLQRASDRKNRRYARGVYHCDVQTTVRESLEKLEGRFSVFKDRYEKRNRIGTFC